jgi:hypothetical protein
MISAILRVSLFACVLAGPLCAMKINQERTFGDEASAVGLVLINSLQRG